MNNLELLTAELERVWTLADEANQEAEFTFWRELTIVPEHVVRRIHEIGEEQ